MQETETFIGFEPFPRQADFINAVFSFKYSLCGYGGAMGGGKTYVCLAVLTLLHNLYPKSKSAVIRESTPTLKKTTIPSFKKLVSSDYYKWNGQDNTATFPNGSEMMFISEDVSHDPDGDKFKGLEVNWTFMEQMEELSQSTLDIMTIRTGRHILPERPRPIIFYSVNPSNNWIKEYTWERYKKGTLPKDHYYLPAYITDNEAVTADKNYMDQFKNIDSLTRKRYIEGDWDAFSAKMPWAYAFNETKHTADTEMEITEPVYISFDFNHSPVSCTIWQHYDDKIRCLYELGSVEGLVDLCRQVQDLLGWDGNDLDRLVYVTGDKSGWNRSELIEGNRTAYDIIMQELALTKYSVQAPQTNPNLLKSRELTNSILEKHVNILISNKHCPRLIFDCKFVEADHKHQIVKERNKKEGKADFLDTMRYYLNTYHQDFIRL